MLSKYLLAIMLPPLLLIGWVVVQNLWRKEFGSPPGDTDVLAGRSDCGKCGCTTPCQDYEDQTRTQTRRS